MLLPPSPSTGSSWLVINVLTDVRPLDLARGEADVALRMSPTSQRELVTRSLCTMPWRLFASADYVGRQGKPASVEDLRGHEVVAYEAPLAHVPGARWLDEHAEGARVVLRGNSLRAIVDAVAAGVGASPARRAVVHPDLVQVARARAVVDFLAEAVLRDHAAGVFG